MSLCYFISDKCFDCDENYFFQHLIALIGRCGKTIRKYHCIIRYPNDFSLDIWVWNDFQFNKRASLRPIIALSKLVKQNILFLSLDEMSNLGPDNWAFIWFCLVTLFKDSWNVKNLKFMGYSSETTVNKSSSTK